jgi:protease IV
VKPLTFKSGRFKDMLSSSKDLDSLSPQERADFAEEEAMLGKMIGETFGRFKMVIKEGREWANGKNAAGKESGQKLSSNWTDFADGRILSGKEAKAIGLVDELGNLDVAVNRAKNLAGISEARLVSYQAPFSLGDFFGILGESNAKGVKIDLGLDMPKLRPGLHYLATSFLP